LSASLPLLQRLRNFDEKGYTWGAFFKEFQDLRTKQRIWQEDAAWHVVSTAGHSWFRAATDSAYTPYFCVQHLIRYCPTASETWTDLMRELRTTVHDARQELTRDLKARFDRTESLKLDVLQNGLATGSWERDVRAQRIILELFDEGSLLEDTGLHVIERKCFEECISLMQAAVESGEEM
jgi:hypothetical protein